MTVYLVCVMLNLQQKRQGGTLLCHHCTHLLSWCIRVNLQNIIVVWVGKQEISCYNTFDPFKSLLVFISPVPGPLLGPVFTCYFSLTAFADEVRQASYYVFHIDPSSIVPGWKKFIPFLQTELAWELSAITLLDWGLMQPLWEGNQGIQFCHRQN